ncbi:hypothetical protein RDI58_019287 [Solanum bulbocastanum]|uniref:Uncharacterized protein n=1 Tax=Solanum bulbocastanum TaxID=147425 RepID=A0AAN8TD00_SOLBU
MFSINDIFLVVVVPLQLAPPSWCSSYQFDAVGGLLTNASCSSTSYDATRSVSKKNFLEDTFSFKINGTNHTSLYFQDKWLLDASDDEYGGVLVN